MNLAASGYASARQCDPNQLPSSDQRASPNYRPDIDGLRALAVLPIVAFHLGFQRVGGGYIGVDIFFVISGYLIGGNVLRQIHGQSWSVIDFYVRRFRRIVPALAVMLVATTIFAWFVLLPAAYANYGKSLIATVLFGSNLYFWKTSSYFAAASDTMPLLHTWSLGLEEQYYIFFPLLMVTLRRCSSRRTRAVISVIALTSFVGSTMLLGSDPASTFYLLPTRIWELLLGVLAVETRTEILKVQRWREGLASVGLFSVLAPILVYSSATPFPGLSAVPPCLGTAMLLVSGAHGETLVSRLLQLRIFIFFGLISYSLYLWHWPVIVLLRESLPASSLDAPLRILAFAIAVALAFASWKLIERPWRSSKVPPRMVLLGTFGSGAMLSIVGVWLVTGFGIPSRFSALALRYASIQDDSTTNDFREGSCFISSAFNFADFDRTRCLHRDPAKINVLLLGDSHAAHLWQGLRQRYPQLNLLQATASGCRPTVEPDPQAAPRCGQMMRFVFDRYLAQHPVDWVILSGSWDNADASHVAATLDWFRAHDFDVVLAGPVVRYNIALPQLLALAEERGDRELVGRARRADGFRLDATFRGIAARHGAIYFSPYRALCGNGACRVTDTRGMPLQFDYGHLTGAGSYIVARAFPISSIVRMRSATNTAATHTTTATLNSELRDHGQ